MNIMIFTAAIFMLGTLAATKALGQVTVVTKPQVSELVRAVENGVDEFEKYLERKGENAKAAAQSQSGTRKRRNPSQATTDSRKARAEHGAEELDEALDGLNRSTNRLRRRFNKVTNYIETKTEVQRVVDDGRRVNSLMVKGSYRTEAERAWAALRNAINQLARTYGIPPMSA